jgi:hypothetical protein
MTPPARTVYFVTHPDVLIDPAVPVAGGSAPSTHSVES